LIRLLGGSGNGKAQADDPLRLRLAQAVVETRSTIQNVRAIADSTKECQLTRELSEALDRQMPRDVLKVISRSTFAFSRAPDANETAADLWLRYGIYREQMNAFIKRPITFFRRWVSIWSTA